MRTVTCQQVMSSSTGKAAAACACAEQRGQCFVADEDLSDQEEGGTSVGVSC